MDKLIKTLPAILAAAGGSEEVTEAACVAAWKHVVGEILNSHAVPVQLKDQTLTIAVSDNIWQRQLEQLRGQLLFRLNSALGQGVVKSIELSIQPNRFMPVMDQESTAADNPIGRAVVPIELISAAAGIQDPGLRRAFLGAALSCENRLDKQRPSPTSDI